MLFAVDFELTPKEGFEDRLDSLTEDPILHWVGFRIEAANPALALEIGITRLKQAAPEVGGWIHSLEASVEPV